MNQTQQTQEKINMLTEKHQTTINNIKELQEIEKYMFQNLEKYKSSEGQEAIERENIVNRINELTQIRLNLFNQLKNMYNEKHSELTDDKNNLSQQMTMINVIENELNNMKNNMRVMRDNKNNKMRLIELGNYESDKYKANTYIMKVIALTAIVILIISALFKNGIIPGNISSGLITIVGGVSLIIILRNIYDIYSRSNLNFNQYNFGDVSPDQIKTDGDTVLHHDKLFFEKLGGDIENNFKKAKDYYNKKVHGLTKYVNKERKELDSLVHSGKQNNNTNKTVMRDTNIQDVMPNDTSNTENFETYS